MQLTIKQKLMNRELFLPIIGYEGLYEISDQGNVKTFNWRNTDREAILRPATDNKGYLRVALQKEGKLRTFKVHRLVAIAFIPNPDNKPMVNHKDLDKKNNIRNNLEWVTAKENTQHAITNGIFVFTSHERAKNITPKRGELNGMSLLTSEKVIEIRRKYRPFKYTREMLSNEYGVTVNCIKDVISRISWKHI